MALKTRSAKRDLVPGRVGGTPTLPGTRPAFGRSAPFARYFQALLLVLTSAASSFAATPTAVFGDRPLIPAELDAARKELPAPLRPAVDFQRLLQRIRSGTPITDWKPEMAKFLNAAPGDPVATALSEAAKIWLARAAMTQIDATLRKYYRKEVAFPPSLAAVKNAIPPEAQDDPWGQPWIYKPTVPHGLAKLASQRYQLGPTRFPTLSPLEQAIASPAPLVAPKFTMRDVGGAKAMELRTPEGKTAILQAGGRAAEIGVIYIGDGWAVLADTERLFTVAF